jgi:hypothetical protein
MTRYCSTCGAGIEGDTPVCSSCGETTGKAHPATPDLAWTFDIPLINNILLIRDLVIAFGIGLAFIVVLLTVVSGAWSEPGGLFELGKLIALLVGILFACFLITVLLLKNRIQTHFFISRDGAGYASANASQNSLPAAVVVAGALAKSPRTMGAGMLASAEQSGLSSWDDVTRVTIHPRQYAIDLKSSTDIKPIRLYCTKENFKKAAELVKNYACHAEIRTR